MICILHGWLLEGSGSNLWTRSIVKALARAGETVHLVCQENHPDLYDSIAEAYRYDENARREPALRREVPYPGRCVLHQPWIGETLPVFVWDKYEQYSRVVPMIDLSDEEIETYIERNASVLRTIVRDYGITAIHANHAVLMSVVAQRVGREAGIPFAIMPHGSGIEYAVKKDPRFAAYATRAFEDAAKIFVIGSEMRQRVNDVFASVPDIDDKCVELHLGVDTSQFDLVPHQQRPERIQLLRYVLANAPRGKTPEQTRTLLSRLSVEMDHYRLREVFLDAAHYDAKLPDADLEEKLAGVDWSRHPTLLFTGRVISMKGIHSVIAALPLILVRIPELRLVIVGHGPLREAMEAFVWALEHGERALVEQIVSWGKFLEGDPEGEAGSRQLTDVARFYAELDSRKELDSYFAAARAHVRMTNVLFTGYLKHDQLRFLFPCCDVGVFPSIVREAGPLVFLEALASGCFPLGTYFGGMAASIDAASNMVPADVAKLMRLDPHDTVRDIATHVPLAVERGEQHRGALAQLARERYDWASVGAVLKNELSSVAKPSPR
jgi:glycosyltransferase involved in cell wall biosynthesis